MKKDTNGALCFSCYECDFCDDCYHCYDCNFSSYSRFCNSCDFSHFCYYSDMCMYCTYCDFSKNLKMTESNIFCYAENYLDENSVQQEQYRAFNRKVSEERYEEIKEYVRSMFDDFRNAQLKDIWKSVTNSHWEKLLAIPEAKDFKEGFEFISGQKINLNSREVKIIELEGKKYKLTEI